MNSFVFEENPKFNSFVPPVQDVIKQTYSSVKKEIRDDLFSLWLKDDSIKAKWEIAAFIIKKLKELKLEPLRNQFGIILKEVWNDVITYILDIADSEKRYGKCIFKEVFAAREIRMTYQKFENDNLLNIIIFDEQLQRVISKTHHIGIVFKSILTRIIEADPKKELKIYHYFRGNKSDIIFQYHLFKREHGTPVEVISLLDQSNMMGNISLAECEMGSNGKLATEFIRFAKAVINDGKEEKDIAQSLVNLSKKQKV